MPTCETCGNDYDKAFKVVVSGEDTRSTASSAPFMRSHRSASIAVAGSSDTAWRRTEYSTAAITAPRRMA